MQFKAELPPNHPQEIKSYKIIRNHFLLRAMAGSHCNTTTTTIVSNPGHTARACVCVCVCVAKIDLLSLSAFFKRISLSPAMARACCSSLLLLLLLCYGSILGGMPFYALSLSLSLSSLSESEGSLGRPQRARTVKRNLDEEKASQGKESDNGTRKNFIAKPRGLDVKSMLIWGNFAITKGGTFSRFDVGAPCAYTRHTSSSRENYTIHNVTSIVVVPPPAAYHARVLRPPLAAASASLRGRSGLRSEARAAGKRRRRLADSSCCCCSACVCSSSLPSSRCCGWWWWWRERERGEREREKREREGSKNHGVETETEVEAEVVTVNEM